MASTIEDLYKYYDVLAEAKENASKHVDTYLKIVESTKKGAKEKQLASQFITRFIKYYPKETSTLALDAMFDLCEDEDVNIRKQAVKDLSTIAREIPEHLGRISDILAQLLQTDDLHESIIVQNSLLAVLKQNPKDTLKEIFNQITSTEIEEVRKRAIRFLVAKLPQLATESVLTRELEEYIVKSTKQVLIDVDAEEFVLLIKLLHCLPSMNTLNGRQEMVNIIQAQSELDKPLDINDTEKLMILLSCTQQAIALFSKNVPSNKFISYYMDYVFPVLNKFQLEENIKLEILKCFADISSFQSNCSNENLTHERLLNLFNLLLEYLPRPVDEPTVSVAASGTDDVKFNFSFVECLMYALHELVKLRQDFLSDEQRLKEFRLRLQYFATGTQNYIKELKNTVSKDDQSQENKVRKIALKVTTNIDVLIKDLFHNPPSFKSTISLSWRCPVVVPEIHSNNSSPAIKRAHSRDDTHSDTNKRKQQHDSHNNNNNGTHRFRGNSYSRGNGNRRGGGGRHY